MTFVSSNCGKGDRGAAVAKFNLVYSFIKSNKRYFSYLMQKYALLERLSRN